MGLKPFIDTFLYFNLNFVNNRKIRGFERVKGELRAGRDKFTSPKSMT
jgi:hypothetical protein